MALPKSLTTVTPLSRGLAIALFILFPVLGFILGIEYQKTVNEPLINSKENVTTRKFSPPINLIGNWQKYTNDKYRISIEYPSDIKLITELHEPKQSNEWHLLLTNQKDYFEKINNNLYGKGFYYIQIEIFDSTIYDVPFKGKVEINENNLDLFLQSNANPEKGFLRSRPTLKTKDTVFPKNGHITYAIYDYNRLIKVKVDTDNLDIIPFSTLDKIVSSFQLL